MEKGDVGVAKYFSKKYGNKGCAFNYLQSESYVKIHLLIHPTSMPPEPSPIFYYLKFNSGIGQ